MADSGAPFNGGTPGALVSPGQYALDWVTSLGGTLTADAAGTGIVCTMPTGPDGLPVPLPQELASMIAIWQQSILAATQGKVWPPNALTYPCFGFGTVTGLPFVT
jgi:hypothetical protein